MNCSRLLVQRTALCSGLGVVTDLRDVRQLRGRLWFWRALASGTAFEPAVFDFGAAATTMPWLPSHGACCVEVL